MIVIANRFWIGDGGAVSDTAHWSDASGGTGGFSVPTATDAVIFDANSFTTGSQTVTMGGANRVGASINWTGVTNTPTWNMGGYSFTSSGDVTLIAGMTISNAGNLIVDGTSTVDVAGHVFANVSFTGTSNIYDLASDITTATFTHTRSELNTNDYAITCSVDFLSNGTNTRTLNLGASVITVSGHFTLTSTGLTFDSGTSLIAMNSASAKNFTGAGKTFYDLEISGNGNKTIVGANTFNDISFGTGTGNLIFPASTTTIINDFPTNGTDGGSIHTIKSNSAGVAATINTSNAIDANYYDVKDITKAGSGSITFTYSYNTSGNTGITFTTPLSATDRYWIGDSGGWGDTAHWSAGSGLAGGFSVPTSSINAHFDANSFTTGSQTVTGLTSNANCKDMNWTGATNTPAYDPNTGGVTVAGDLTFITAMTISGGTSRKITVSGGTGAVLTVTTAGRTIGNLTLTANTTGSITLLDDVTCTTFAHTSSVCDTGGFNIDCDAFTSSGATTRTLYLNDSIITCTGTGTVTFTSTGLTLDEGTSKFILTGATGKTFAGGGNTFYDLESSVTTLTLSGNNTFHNIYGTADKTLKFTIGSATTISDLPNDGTAGHLISMISSSAGSSFILSKSGAITEIDYYSIKDCASNSKIYAKRSTNVSNNSGIYFYSTPTGSKYWVGNGGNWQDSTHWANASGGIGDQPKPTYTDTVIFDANSFTTGSQTVTGASDPTGHAEVLTINFTNVTNNPTVYHYFQVRGTSATFSANMAVAIGSYASRVLFVPVANTTAYLTSAGQYFDYVSVSGDDRDLPVTLELLDALDVRALQVFWAANFKSNNHAMTALGTNSVIDFQGADTVTLGTSEIHTTDFQATTYLTPFPVLVISHSGDLYATKSIIMSNPYADHIFNMGNLFLGEAGIEFRISANVKCTDLTLYKGCTYKFYDAHIDSSQGNSIQFVTLFQDATAGHVITINKFATYNGNFICLTGIVSVDWWVIYNNDASGGATFYAGANSTDGGGNSGWIWSAPPTGFNIYLGTIQISAIYLGTIPIDKVYFGTIAI